MLIEPSDDDEVRQFDENEKSILTSRLLELHNQVKTIDSKVTAYSIELFCGWHRYLFEGIRDHAGRVRGPDYGEERLVFGGHRSAHKDEVAGKLAQHLVNAHCLFRQLDSFKQNSVNDTFVRDVITAALYIHADLVQIHPFRDGNGRVSRLVFSYCVCRYGLPNVSFEVPKQEYIECLHNYLVNDEIDPFIDLTLRLYRNQRL